MKRVGNRSAYRYKTQNFGGFGKFLGGRIGGGLGKRFGGMFGKRLANKFLPWLTKRLGKTLFPGLPFFSIKKR
ncbi:MAG: hypothetical protein ACYC21_11500 [Eubacteriales bacterium]